MNSRKTNVKPLLHYSVLLFLSLLIALWPADNPCGATTANSHTDINTLITGTMEKSNIPVVSASVVKQDKVDFFIKSNWEEEDSFER